MEIAVVITHDNYPQEVSWILRDKCNGDEIIEERLVNNYSGQNGQTTTDTFSVTKGWFEFEFQDSYGDGLCCPPGSYYVTVDGVTVAPPSGTQFLSGVSQTSTIGSDTNCLC